MKSLTRLERKEDRRLKYAVPLINAGQYAVFRFKKGSVVPRCCMKFTT